MTDNIVDPSPYHSRIVPSITGDDSTLDTLMNPIPAFNASTNLTRIDRRQGQNIPDNDKLQIQATFLEEFSKRANVTDSAAAAGIDRTLVYYWLKHDPNFADGYTTAEEQANDVLRREAWRRATDGVREPIVSMGKLVRDDNGNPLTVQKYDTPLLILLMRARMPEYKDSKNVDINQTTTVNTSHQISIDTRNMSTEDLQVLRAIAERMQGKAGDNKQIETGRQNTSYEQP